MNIEQIREELQTKKVLKNKRIEQQAKELLASEFGKQLKEEIEVALIGVLKKMLLKWDRRNIEVSLPVEDLIKKITN